MPQWFRLGVVTGMIPLAHLVEEIRVLSAERSVKFVRGIDIRIIRVMR